MIAVILAAPPQSCNLAWKIYIWNVNDWTQFNYLDRNDVRDPQTLYSPGEKHTVVYKYAMRSFSVTKVAFMSGNTSSHGR